ncbi:polymorphic PE/PPE family protein [Mycobacterium xenopi 3993]|nr:polymorphic PE/PPE family protein [Mycobacterium xenopi 3993]
MAPLTSTMSMPLSATTSAPLAASSSSSGTPPLSTLTGLTTSSTALTSGASVASGAGSSASLGASGASMLGSAGSLMRTVTPAMGMFGNLQAVGSALGSGSGALASPGLGGAAVTAGLGRATSVGVLSVPQSWASAAPAFNSVASSLPATSASAAARPSAPPTREACLVPRWHLWPAAARRLRWLLRRDSMSVPPWCNARSTPVRKGGQPCISGSAVTSARNWSGHHHIHHSQPISS